MNKVDYYSLYAAGGGRYRSDHCRIPRVTPMGSKRTASWSALIPQRLPIPALLARAIPNSMSSIRTP